MANINVNGLAENLTEQAVKTYELVKDKLPNVSDFDANPERLLNLQGENADIIGALFKSSIGETEYICRNGRAIIQCANEINRIDKRVGMAILIGGVALGGVCYAVYKIRQQQEQINALNRRVGVLETLGATQF